PVRAADGIAADVQAAAVRLLAADQAALRVVRQPDHARQPAVPMREPAVGAVVQTQAGPAAAGLRQGEDPAVRRAMDAQVAERAQLALGVVPDAPGGDGAGGAGGRAYRVRHGLAVADDEIEAGEAAGCADPGLAGAGRAVRVVQVQPARRLTGG